jgi:TPP-dependent pyruvate/acetoin dehydrogenase alpha subunit
MKTPLPDPADASHSDIARLYRQLYYVRHVEEEIARIYPSDKIKSPVHLSIGQEAVAVGVCDVLRHDDIVSGTYRGHAVYLAKGGDVNALMAELYGKSGGCAAGKGGSMHLIDMTRNILGTSAVVGTTIPVAVGHALAIKRRGQDRVIAAFLGDGATEEGAFYESINFAALKKLPVLFVCENNGYAIHQPIMARWANADLCERVRSFGLPAHRIDSGDVLEIRHAAGSALARIRAGGGPEFIECKTYRWRGHVGPEEDFDAGYRTHDEAKTWIEADQVVRLAGMIDPAERQRIDGEIVRTVADAIVFAEASPVPEPGELYSDVFAN